MEAFVHDAVLAVALALLAVPEPALLLALLPQATSPTLAVSAVIAATAATVICRIRLRPLRPAIVQRFGRMLGDSILPRRPPKIKSKFTERTVPQPSPPSPPSVVLET